MWVLRTTDEDGTLLFRLLSGAIKTVGRGAGADFVVPAQMVSRVHCRLCAAASGQLEVEDLSSTNGTFVNGRRVEHAVLVSGDRLRVGRVELLVELVQQQNGVDHEQARRLG